jgi:hypothetical protein
LRSFCLLLTGVCKLGDTLLFGIIVLLQTSALEQVGRFVKSRNESGE